MLILEKLSLNKNRIQILSEISFEISNSEVIVLAGRNGAGKTSLLGCISGTETSYTGTIETSNSEIAFLLNKPCLYSYLTGYQNIDIFRRYQELPKSVIDEALNLFHLAEYANQKVSTYSSGMKQRLSFATVFLKRPDIMILDEPFNTLDVENSASLKTLIQTLQRNFGTTFIISTHDLRGVSEIINRLLILKSGRIVRDISIDTSTVSDVEKIYTEAHQEQ